MVANSSIFRDIDLAVANYRGQAREYIYSYDKATADLAVKDAEALRKLITALLGSSGYRVLEAANGFTGRPSRYGWLTRIWHMHPPLITSKLTSARHAARFGFPNTSKQRF